MNNFSALHFPDRAIIYEMKEVGKQGTDCKEGTTPHLGSISAGRLVVRHHVGRVSRVPQLYEKRMGLWGKADCAALSLKAQ